MKQLHSQELNCNYIGSNVIILILIIILVYVRRSFNETRCALSWPASNLIRVWLFKNNYPVNHFGVQAHYLSC